MHVRYGGKAMKQEISQQKDEADAQSSQVKQVADLIEGLVRGGKSITAAVSFLKLASWPSQKTS